MIGAWLMSLAVTAEGGSAVQHAGAGAWLPIAGYLSVLTLLTVVATFFTPETKGRSLEDPRDAIDERRL
jgi:MHS family metabolite:H+ symporter-like MFS transporter